MPSEGGQTHASRHVDLVAEGEGYLTREVPQTTQLTEFCMATRGFFSSTKSEIF